MKRLLSIFLILVITGLAIAQNSNVLLDYKLRKVFYKGNTSFSDRQLKRYVDIKPVFIKSAMKRITYRFIKLQAKSLQNYYISEGFLNCSVKDSLIINQGNELHLYFNVKENERFNIKQISIEGNTLLTDGEILELLDVKVGEPFRQYIYYSNFKKILAKYSELGHPFAGIREEYDWGTDLEITLFIDEDISYNVDQITLKGNKTVGGPFIRKHFNIKEGKPYQLEKINQTKDRIYEMGAFNSVNIVPVNPDTSNQSLDLEVSVIESKAHRFDVQFGARQGYTEKISYSSLFLEPEWTHKNLFHRAHRFRVGFTYDALIQNDNINHLINAEIGYTVPWLIFLRLPTTFKIYFDRDTYNPFDDTVREDTLQVGEIRTDYGINISSIWRYNRNIYTRFSISLRNLKSELNGISSGFEPQTKISLQSRFDNRDNFIYPTKGWNILLYGGYVLGTDKETETEYFRLESSVNGYARLARNLVLAARLEAGQFFDMETIDPLMIYQLGSETTVRGWVKSIGNPYEIINNDSTSSSTIYAGKAKILGNIELRMDLVWNFGIDVFVDAGRLEDDFSNILDWSGYFMNTGIGIYYKTPIGPVRVEFPFILNDPSGNENEFTFNRISFGLLFAF